MDDASFRMRLPMRYRGSLAKSLTAGAVSLLLTAAVAGCGGDASDSGQAFYHGKTLEIIVPADPGGGSDVLARFLAPLISQYVEGKPKVVVRNVPGGGTLTGSGRFMSAPHDGETAFVHATSSLTLAVVGKEGVSYDIADTKFVAGVPSNHITLVRADAGGGVSSAADLPKVASSLKVGEQNAEGDGSLSLLGWEVLGLRDKVDFVFGYDGGGAMSVALGQGEINAYMTPVSAYSSLAPKVADGTYVPMFTNGRPDESGKLERDPAHPDVPTIAEVYEQLNGKPPTGDAWNAFVALQSILPNQVLALPGDAPEDAYNALVTGLTAARNAPDFKEKFTKLYGDYPLLVGNDWKTLTDAAANLDDQTTVWVQEFLENNYDVKGLARP